MEILKSPKATNANLSVLKHRYRTPVHLQNLDIEGAWPCFDHRLYSHFTLWVWVLSSDCWLRKLFWSAVVLRYWDSKRHWEFFRKAHTESLKSADFAETVASEAVRTEYWLELRFWNFAPKRSWSVASMEYGQVWNPSQRICELRTIRNWHQVKTWFDQIFWQIYQK